MDLQTAKDYIDDLKLEVERLQQELRNLRELRRQLEVERDQLQRLVARHD